MMQSFSSKIGHTRTDNGENGGVNHHADHHTLHQKNFGFGSTVFVDMLFGTNADNDVYEVGLYTVSRSESEHPTKTTFTFVRTTRSDAEAEDLELRIQRYYSPTLETCTVMLQRAVLRMFSK